MTCNSECSYQNPLLSDIDAGCDMGLTEAEQKMVVEELLDSKPEDEITEEDVFNVCISIISGRADRAEYARGDR